MSDQYQSTCGECGSDMTPVRPGKWQCDVCETKAMIRREQAKVLRWAADKVATEMPTIRNLFELQNEIKEIADKVERGEIEVTP